MKSRFRKLGIEALEGRRVMSATAFGDFNHDGRMDTAAITAPTTITVSLANPDGSFTLSATLTTAKNRPIQDVYVVDRDGDGDLDIVGLSPPSGNKSYSYTWLGNGDGTFDSGKTEVFRWPPPPGHGGGW